MVTTNQSAQPAAANADAATTLAIDIGGSGTKVILLDSSGQPLGERARLKTPSPATPDAVMATIEKLVADQPPFDRVSVGFPGVVRHGVVYTAVNLTKAWVGYPLADQLSQRLKRPVKVANDADIQGFGAISGHGVELVVTLGTGFGSALFVDGHLVPNLEMAHHRFRKSETYEEQLGRAALEKIGKEKWNRRLQKAIESLEHLFNYDRLYIGGGETKNITFELPDNATTVPNVLGLLGGIALWQD
ncbi:MAG: ROK family protein [Cyanobacteria bacterium P01_H01_bin.21]